MTGRSRTSTWNTGWLRFARPSGEVVEVRFDSSPTLPRLDRAEWRGHETGIDVLDSVDVMRRGRCDAAAPVADDAAMDGDTETEAAWAVEGGTDRDGPLADGGPDAGGDTPADAEASDPGADESAATCDAGLVPSKGEGTRLRVRVLMSGAPGTYDLRTLGAVVTSCPTGELVVNSGEPPFRCDGIAGSVLPVDEPVDGTVKVFDTSPLSFVLDVPPKDGHVSLHVEVVTSTDREPNYCY